MIPVGMVKDSNRNFSTGFAHLHKAQSVSESPLHIEPFGTSTTGTHNFPFLHNNITIV